MSQIGMDASRGRRRYRDGGGRGAAGPDPSPYPDLNPELASQSAAEHDLRVREALRRGQRWLSFPAALEARYESDQAAAQRRRLLLAAWLAWFTYLGLLVVDQRVMPDVADWLVQIHVIFSALLLAGIVLIAMPLPPPMREAIYTAFAICAVIAGTSPILNSTAPASRGHLSALVLVVMLTGIAARLRFRWTLLLSVAVIEAMLMVPPGPPPGDLLLGDAQLFIAGVTVITLIAAYTLEHHDRLAWLNRMLAEQQRLALEEANAQLARIALFDVLTGIHNRRYFENELPLSCSEAARLRQCLSVLIADVDHFKLYNDGYGHPAGDACLRAVAQALQAVAVRAGGLVARLGGEEFVLLLPACDADRAQAVARAAVAEVAALRLPHRLSPVLPLVTISVGHTTRLPDDTRRPGDLLEDADHALYGAKTAGRNRASAVPPSAALAQAHHGP